MILQLLKIMLKMLILSSSGTKQYQGRSCLEKVNLSCFVRACSSLQIRKWNLAKVTQQKGWGKAANAWKWASKTLLKVIFQSPNTSWKWKPCAKKFVDSEKGEKSLNKENLFHCQNNKKWCFYWFWKIMDRGHWLWSPCHRGCLQVLKCSFLLRKWWHCHGK
jgi:hypothetical protein